VSSARHDVIIMGSGMSGTQLGAILAHQGFRVMIIEEQSHPRFTIGESTIPETSMMNRIIAERYGVPEIGFLSDFYSLSTKVASSTGVKRNFGFVHHREGQARIARDYTQSIIPELPFGPESHIYRQDIDAYLLHVAIRYGCEARQRTTIADYQLGPDKVVLRAKDGETFVGRYLIDCGGPRAPIPTKLGLREDPPRYQTHSRTLYTHMVGVRPFDEIFHAEGQRWKWHEGTLHHIFDGGWLWVIPFNNHARATNSLVSVGLQLDPRRYPKNGTAQEEWEGFLKKYPTIAAQFAGARPVRDWVHSDRLQFSSKHCVGPRWAMMVHATGFIDPLFSRGLENTAVTIHALASRLVKALRDDDFSMSRFEYIECLQQKLLEHNDDLVAACYVAFRDFRLWDAFHRMWISGAVLGVLRLQNAYWKFMETRDPAVLDALDEGSLHLGFLVPDVEDWFRLYTDARAEVQAFEEGKISADRASNNIHRMIDQTKIVPPLFGSGFCTSGAGMRRAHSKYNMLPVLRLLRWAKMEAPSDVKKYFSHKNRHFVEELGDYVRKRIPTRI
jgi:FADH2 O2-dependent halogenase